MKRGVQGIETAALDLAREQKSRLDALPMGHPYRPIIEAEIRDLGALKNRMQIERIKEEVMEK